jgi:hypothetical protein
MILLHGKSRLLELLRKYPSRYIKNLPYRKIYFVLNKIIVTNEFVNKHLYE